MFGVFSRLKISVKLPLIIISLLLTGSIIQGGFAALSEKESLLHAEDTKLEALSISRREALTNYLESIEQDLSALAENDYVRRALFDFTTGWNELGGNQTGTLQKLYITDNPHPTGSKEELDHAPDGSIYSMVHAKYHPWFRHFLRLRDYYDIFLFDPDGNLVYTVFKELDYATNMNTGRWKDTDLANAFRTAKDAGAGKQVFFDFKPYAPSHGAPASFIAQPVMDDHGRLAGVLVFQMPIARIDHVMQVQAGMGESGETYLVGSDYLMRSDSRFSKESTILKTRVDGETVRAALRGETGVKIVPDYLGVPVISAYTPIEFKGTTWAVMAEIDLAEAMIPVKETVIHTLGLSAMIVLAVALIALFYSGPLPGRSGVWLTR